MMLQKKHQKQKGVALMLAMFTIILVSYLAMELAYQTNVEYLINSQAVQGIRAYYAAKAGLQLSLLRIKIYLTVQANLPAQAKGLIKPDLLNMIWNMPFSWPPMIPTEASSVDKDLLGQTMKESFMEASYMVTISDEGSKVDVNDLASPVPAIRDLTKKRLLEIIETKKRLDQRWADEHQDLRADVLVNNISDWVTPGRQSANGGDKVSRYAKMGESYPPNRAFRTTEELRLVPDMTDDAFEALREQVTVFGSRAINVNTVGRDVFLSLDPAVTKQIADQLIDRRSNLGKGGPFKNAQDFWQTLAGFGARVSPQLQESLMIVTDTVVNFRIKSVGNSLKSTREVVAVVYDVQDTASQVAQSINSAANPAGAPPPGGTATTPAPQNKNTSSKGPPRIVYWKER